MLANNIEHIHNRIIAAAQGAGRDPGNILLLAVSKKHSTTVIREAYAAGLRAFGENYVQEASAKMVELSDCAIEWHYIGQIQSNKTRKIAEHFAWAHSVNSYHIAQRLSDQRPPHLSPLNICIQVNQSGEASKQGIAAGEVLGLCKAIDVLSGVKLRGLMTLPAPAATMSGVVQQAFRELRELKEQVCSHGIELDTLSMGMSADFEVAIAEGATIVRIGTALLGGRDIGE